MIVVLLTLRVPFVVPLFAFQLRPWEGLASNMWPSSRLALLHPYAGRVVDLRLQVSTVLDRSAAPTSLVRT
jgi:hypothetical protein